MSQAPNRYIPEHWGPTLASLCNGTAVTLRTIAHSKPSESEEDQKSIHDFFDTNLHSVPDLTEQINQGLADHSSNLLRGLGTLIDQPVVTQAVTAPLVVACLETNSLLKFINQFKSIHRCYWAARTITLNINSPKRILNLRGFNDLLEVVQTTYEKKLSTHRAPFLDDAILVSEMMKGRVSNSFYEEQYDYTHQHALSGFYDANWGKQHPETAEFGSILGNVYALRSADSAARLLANFRDSPDAAEALELLDAIADIRENMAHEVNELLEKYNAVN